MYLVVVVFLDALVAAGQGVPALKEEAPTTLRSTTRLVVVPTLVKTASGELVEGLSASDFRVFDNGVEQKVFVEEVERQPLAVVVLLQTGGAAARQFQNYRNLSTMLDYMMGSSSHKVAMMTFDSQTEDTWRFTSEVDDLKEGLEHPKSGDGGAAIIDAVDEAIDLLKKQPVTSRHIILLFSQPQDDGSAEKAEDVVRRLEIGRASCRERV